MRLFLDTNVYIIGAADRHSDEGLILDWLGFWQKTSGNVEVIISRELLEQVSRVAKRLRNKDWSGELVGRIWQNFDVHHVFLDEQAFTHLEEQAVIPREDIGVYLTAQTGQAQYFISANHRLIRSLVQETQEFACLTPSEFVQEHLEDF
jgi:predicted nucleic acid-binding protein